jgi:hypothetical protein
MQFCIFPGKYDMNLNKKRDRKSIATINMRCTAEVYNAWAKITRSDAFTTKDENGVQSRPPAGHILMELIRNYEATQEASRKQTLPVQDYVRGREYINSHPPVLQETQAEEIDRLLS